MTIILAMHACHDLMHVFVSCTEVQITWGTGLGVDHEGGGPGLQIKLWSGYAIMHHIHIYLYFES